MKSIKRLRPVVPRPAATVLVDELHAVSTPIEINSLLAGNFPALGILFDLLRPGKLAAFMHGRNPHNEQGICSQE